MAIKIQGVPVITDLRELINLSNGTLSTPSISFGTDTDTGFFHPSADKISVVTGGTVKMEVNPTTVVLTSADINGGTMDSTIIGASTPAAASVTTLTATSTINSSTDIQINGESVLDTALALAIALG